MKSSFAKAFAIGLGLVVLAVGAILFMQRGAHIDLPGTIKVRTLSTSPDESLVLVDLHVTNPSDYAFEVRNITVRLETQKGDMSRETVSKSDAQRLFEAMPEAGPYHPTLYTNAPIPAHATADYTLVAPFPAPESMLKDRQRFVVTLEEINGKQIEFSEK